jgi:hypothetical protein
MNDTIATTPVILRRWRAKISYDRTLIAIFPTIPSDAYIAPPSRCLTYEHIGQHGTGDYSNIRKNSTPIRKGWEQSNPEVRELVTELRDIGYIPILYERVTPYLAQEAEKAWKLMMDATKES